MFNKNSSEQLPKGMVACKNCQEHIAKNAKFCPHCGEKHAYSNRPPRGMTACKTCKEHIAKSAKICPHCGAKCTSVSESIATIITFVFIVLIIKAVLSGNSTSKKQNGPTVRNSSSQSSAISEQTTTPSYTIGDTLELDEIVITLKDVRINHGNSLATPQDGYEYIIFEFDIENNSSRTLYASSYWDFEAYADDYILSSSTLGMMCDGGNRIGDSIDSGRKLNGIVGYEVKRDWKNVEVIFELSSIRNKKFTFTVSKNQVH